MTNQHSRRVSQPRIFLLLTAVVILLGSSLYIFRAHAVPAGFHIDESSIAYNAFTISQSGRDEHGKPWPLFFTAFGDYKNPVYIYLLALIFKLTGPSIPAARLLSAFCGITTVLLLGWLVFRILKSQKPQQAMPIALLVMLTAFLTPWLFEMSRVTIEVALFPVAIVLFLLSVERLTTRVVWSWTNVLCLAFSLSLVAYTYSIGRLLAPLLAFGLLIFVSRESLPGILRTWAVFLATLIPLINFQRTNNGALTDRFRVVTYIKPGTTLTENIWEFFKHYFGNLDPRRMFWHGDPNVYQVAHVYNQPALLIATALLLIAGVCLLLLFYRKDTWWRFVVYGTLASLVPASLTDDYFHLLRLSALPVFLLLVTVPAWIWILDQRSEVRRLAVGSLILLTLLQGALFQVRYHQSAQDSWRRHVLDAEYEEKIFKFALAQQRKPIYLADSMSTPYIQAFWYSTLHGIPRSDFVRLGANQPVNKGDLVISTDEVCLPPTVLAQVDPYSVYLADPKPRLQEPLPATGFKAEIAAEQGNPLRFSRGQPIQMQVKVKNVSDRVWPGCSRDVAAFQLFLASHWLDESGRWFREEGRTPLPKDVAPGETVILNFRLSPPIRAGNYTIELDMLQEEVAWFGSKGSQTTKVQIIVE